ncbi:hypothetical protein N7508_010617 [Penicillium antarcticum]|uniref:uncharacterized protein n=1 Tax=Penicillium antarcticum TaxID=416450 RepID=UPI00239D8814|nr:uncharacterized protein N7508_010617 [Penicillium antarcticum]KAJ5295796.1 hypothetical protein N7508_010617 [Penicillium antarcticum]
MAYNWDGALTPSKANDWGLREMPCWPSFIAPDGPGFPLLTNDMCILRATQIRRRNELEDDEIIQIIEDGFAVSGENTTRRLTEDEISDNVELIHCQDSTCEEEIEALVMRTTNISSFLVLIHLCLLSLYLTGPHLTRMPSQ